jgi:hypothetical protein
MILRLFFYYSSDFNGPFLVCRFFVLFVWVCELLPIPDILIIQKIFPSRLSIAILNELPPGCELLMPLLSLSPLRPLFLLYPRTFCLVGCIYCPGFYVCKGFNVLPSYVCLLGISLNSLSGRSISCTCTGLRQPSK